MRSRSSASSPRSKAPTSENETDSNEGDAPIRSREWILGQAGHLGKAGAVGDKHGHRSGRPAYSSPAEGCVLGVVLHDPALLPVSYMFQWTWPMGASKRFRMPGGQIVEVQLELLLDEE